MSSSPDRASRLVEAMETLEAQPPPGRRRPEGAPGLLTLPVALRQARVLVGSPVLAGAVVVLLAVLAVVGVRVAWAQRAAEPTPIPRADSAALTSAGPEAAAPGGAGLDASGVAPTTESGPLYVHVIGAVRRAGVVDVAAGSRVGDVVEAAGGLSAGADPGRLNLARLVVDGERIWVPVEGAEPPEEVPAPVSAPAETGSAPGEAASAGSQTPVDLNTADSSTLQTLPGVGPVTAEAILTWRAEHGRFSTVEELVEVSGIGPRTLERLRPQVSATP